MKAMVVSPVGGRVPPSRGVLHNGALGINNNNNNNSTRRDLEAEEVAAYLTKLRSLVPDMPRKRKLSKLEVIQRVIEYICDLQTTLEETNGAGSGNGLRHDNGTAGGAVVVNHNNNSFRNNNNHNNSNGGNGNGSGAIGNECIANSNSNISNSINNNNSNNGSLMRTTTGSSSSTTMTTTTTAAVAER